MTEPEFQSVETFAEFLVDEDRTSFTAAEVNAIAVATRTSHHKVRVALEGYGLTLERRANEQRVRGFQTSSHDRYFGPGAEKTHGGSGWEQIAGFAGEEK